jgi:formylglycine-generating enzyme required for sulfatase activity
MYLTAKQSFITLHTSHSAHHKHIAGDTDPRNSSLETETENATSMHTHTHTVSPIPSTHTYTCTYTQRVFIRWEKPHDKGKHRWFKCCKSLGNHKQKASEKCGWWTSISV